MMRSSRASRNARALAGAVLFVVIFKRMMYANALLSNDFTKGAINGLGRLRDPYAEDDMIMKWQLPVTDSHAKRAEAPPPPPFYSQFESVRILNH